MPETSQGGRREEKKVAQSDGYEYSTTAPMPEFCQAWQANDLQSYLINVFAV